MDKSCQQSSRDSSNSTTSTTAVATSSGRDQYLKHLNKLSHKISKPTTTFIKNPPPLIHPQHSHQNQSQPQLQSSLSSSSQVQPQPQQNQPPVYNINKNDFRDVVQRLTGSPAHERFSDPRPPPVQQSKPQNSRLQRIRPPPLSQLGNRPPPLLNSAILPPHQLFHPPANPNIPVPTAATNFGPDGGRQVAPFSPLPPLPTVHAAAESPVSAYMRYLHAILTVDSNSKQFSPLAPTVSPRWHNLAQTQPPHIPPPPPQQQSMNPPPPSSSIRTSQPQFPIPSSPLPFGCLNSPKSPYPWLSPGVLFSPSSGQLGFPQLPPLSPTVPVPSPNWRGL